MFVKNKIKNLRKTRLKLGLTQKEISNMLDMPRQSYQSYESGTRTPSEERAKRIEEGLRIIHHSYLNKNKKSNLTFFLYCLLYLLTVLLIIFLFCGD